MKKDTESLFSSFKVLISEGYYKVAGVPASQNKTGKANDDETEDVKCDEAMLELLQKVKKIGKKAKRKLKFPKKYVIIR